MKKIIIPLTIIISLLFSIFSFVEAAEPIKLKFANYFPLTHKHSLMMEEYTKRLNKDLDGKLKITYYGGGTLLTAPKMASGVASGIADIGLSHVGYTRGRFPVMEIFGLPIGCPSPWIGFNVSNEFFTKFKPKEWGDFHPLMFTTSTTTTIQTTSKQVKTLEDMKGLKIRGTGRVADVVRALGAIPIPIEMIDMYESLRRGVVDGNMGNMEQLKGWKTGEVVKYVTTSWEIGSTDMFYVVMSKKKWNSLSPDIQKIISNVSNEYAQKWAMLWNDIDLEGVEFFNSKGGKIILLDNAESRKWIQAANPVISEFKKDLIAKGYTANEIDHWINFIKSRIEYWKVQEKTRKIQTVYKY